MGMYHSTYFGYGVHVPIEQPAWVEAKRLDTELPKIKDTCPDVGHLTARDYDADMLFLVTEATSLELGKFEHVTPSRVAPEQVANWNAQLALAVHALGYSDASEPGWFVVPDLS